jgi:NTP pyrophosphatase (non-canonical NTP hydrolase)
MGNSFELLSLELERFVEARDWHQFHTPKNMATCIAVEAGELLEHYTWTRDGGGPFPKGTEPPARDVVAAEAADVFMSLLSFCRATDIDLIEVTRQKLQALAERYPVENARGSAEKGRS